MSVEAIAWVLNHAPVESPVSKLVLVALANHAHPDGSAAFPSVATICRYTCLSERSVRQHLDSLEKQGVIRRCDPKIVAAYIDRADRRPIGYDIMLGVQETQVVGQRGAGDSSNGVQEIPERGAGGAPKPSNKPSKEPYTETQKRLVGRLQTLLKETTPTGVAVQCPTADWFKSIQRLLEQGATEQLIDQMMAAAMADPWWRKNIRSAMQLEKHWERLVVEKYDSVPRPTQRMNPQLDDAITTVMNFVRLRKSEDDIMDFINGKPEEFRAELKDRYFLFLNEATR